MPYHGFLPFIDIHIEDGRWTDLQYDSAKNIFFRKWASYTRYLTRRLVRTGTILVLYPDSESAQELSFSEEFVCTLNPRTGLIDELRHTKTQIPEGALVVFNEIPEMAYLRVFGAFDNPYPRDKFPRTASRKELVWEGIDWRGSSWVVTYTNENEHSVQDLQALIDEIVNTTNGGSVNDIADQEWNYFHFLTMSNDGDYQTPRVFQNYRSGYFDGGVNFMNTADGTFFFIYIPDADFELHSPRPQSVITNTLGNAFFVASCVGSLNMLATDSNWFVPEEFGSVVDTQNGGYWIKARSITRGAGVRICKCETSVVASYPEDIFANYNPTIVHGCSTINRFGEFTTEPAQHPTASDINEDSINYSTEITIKGRSAATADGQTCT